jgi:hypothetical protein
VTGKLLGRALALTVGGAVLAIGAVALAMSGGVPDRPGDLDVPLIETSLASEPKPGETVGGETPSQGETDPDEPVGTPEVDAEEHHERETVAPPVREHDEDEADDDAPDEAHDEADDEAEESEPEPDDPETEDPGESSDD